MSAINCGRVIASILCILASTGALPQPASTAFPANGAASRPMAALTGTPATAIKAQPGAKALRKPLASVQNDIATDMRQLNKKAADERASTDATKKKKDQQGRVNANLDKAAESNQQTRSAIDSLGR